MCKKITEPAKIRKGVARAYNVSPVNFNAYIQNVVGEIKEYSNVGLKIQRRKVIILW